MAILNFPLPPKPAGHELGRTSAAISRVSGWEANILTSQNLGKERPTGRILLPLNCVQILSSKRVGKALTVWREKEAALEGLDKHLQLETPDEEAVTAALAFMKTLTLPNGSLSGVPGRQQGIATRPSQNIPSLTVAEPGHCFKKP
jgi:hypothetical protein